LDWSAARSVTIRPSTDMAHPLPLPLSLPTGPPHQARGDGHQTTGPAFQLAASITVLDVGPSGLTPVSILQPPSRSIADRRRLLPDLYLTLAEEHLLSTCDLTSDLKPSVRAPAGGALGSGQRHETPIVWRGAQTPPPFRAAAAESRPLPARSGRPFAGLCLLVRCLPSHQRGLVAFLVCHVTRCGFVPPATSRHLTNPYHHPTTHHHGLAHLHPSHPYFGNHAGPRSRAKSVTVDHPPPAPAQASSSSRVGGDSESAAPGLVSSSQSSASVAGQIRQCSSDGPSIPSFLRQTNQPARWRLVAGGRRGLLHSNQR
jgi:hypothetical protein